MVSINFRNINVTFAILAAISWSIAATTSALAFSAGSGILLLLFVRFLITFIVSFVLNIGSKKTKTNTPYLRLFVISIFSTFFISAYMSAIELVPISIAVSVVYTFPVLTFFANSIMKSRSIDILSAVALFVSLFGIWLLSGSGTDGWNIFGILLALGAAASQTVINIASRHKSIVPGWSLLKYIMAMPAALFTLLFIFNNPEVNILAVTWCFISALGMIGGCYFFYHSIAKIGPVRTSNIMYLEPVFTIAIGVLFLSNIIESSQWLGIGIIMIATLVLELWGKKYRFID
ncbi:MAG TPA: DMT family transporter [Candidatus Thioglobus sp.]|nr:DMT family transporter [Candidatus Thioglobus sp.]HIL42424.1 DMT family transporter [Gammaproteobacteria bacterium]